MKKGNAKKSISASAKRGRKVINKKQAGDNKGQKMIITMEAGNKFPNIGKYVILRCYYAGVHAGFLVDYDPVLDMAILRDSRRLWRWKSKFTLSEAAMTGITGEKVATTVKGEHMIRRIEEMIPCTEKAEKSIREIPDFIA